MLFDTPAEFGRTSLATLWPETSRLLTKAVPISPLEPDMRTFIFHTPVRANSWTVPVSHLYSSRHTLVKKSAHFEVLASFP